MRVVMVEISPPFRINAKIARMAIPMSAQVVAEKPQPPQVAGSHSQIRRENDISGSEEHGKKRKSDHQLIDALLF